MKKVEKREFVRHFSKYLGEGGEYEVEGRDGKWIVNILSDKDLSDSLLSDKEVKVGKISNVIKTKGDAEEEVGKILERGIDPLSYGCGCQKEGGGNLCKRHGRV